MNQTTSSTIALLLTVSLFGTVPAGAAAACREAGLGIGFYYSHHQDWTGQHTLAVSLAEGPRDQASLQAIRLSPAE